MCSGFVLLEQIIKFDTVMKKCFWKYMHDAVTLTLSHDLHNTIAYLNAEKSLALQWMGNFAKSFREVY